MKDYFDFRGKVAIVTGGRRGLGRAMALGLAERGATVAVVDLAPEADEVLAEMKRLGTTGYYFQTDLSKREERSGLIKRIVALCGKERLDILINNAGFQTLETIQSCTVERWDVTMSLMLDAVFELSQQATEFMIPQKSGKIINISSIAAFREGAGAFSYTVAKCGIVGMTRIMANSLAAENINVNAIAPGVFRTAINDHFFQNEKAVRSRIQMTPAKRLAEPEDIVGPMLFLASEQSSYLHGQTIVLDGGFLGS